MTRFVCLLVLVGLGVACASAPKLPPKASPEDVQLFDPNAGQFPDEGYKTIGIVTVEKPLSTTRAEMLMALRVEAARLGADAVVLRAMRETSEGGIDTSTREQKRIAEGLAIYWPKNP